MPLLALLGSARRRWWRFRAWRRLALSPRSEGTLHERVMATARHCAAWWLDVAASLASGGVSFGALFALGAPAEVAAWAFVATGGVLFRWLGGVR